MAKSKSKGNKSSPRKGSPAKKSAISTKKSKLGASMHNAAYQNLGANYVYIPIAVTDLHNAIIGLKALDFRGTAVSMPYKQEIIKYLDKIDPTAKKIGAVNTVLNEGGTLIGYNSDWIGAVEALKEVTKLKGKTAILIGAGGASRAIAYGLKENKTNVIVFVWKLF